MKIIATIGPNSSNKKILAELINNGVNILRLNFSHFYESEFIKILNDSRSIKKDIIIMADLCGKKVRVYEDLKSVFKVYPGDIVYFCSYDVYSLIVNTNEKIKIIPLNIKSEIIEKNDIKKISMKDGTMNFNIIDKDKVFFKRLKEEEYYLRNSKEFLFVPNYAIAYRLSKNTLKLYKQGDSLGKYVNIRIGLDTGNNDEYLRFWHEVGIEKIGFSTQSVESFLGTDYKWAPHTKGGTVRKWYGNYEYVLAFDNKNYNKL